MSSGQANAEVSEENCGTTLTTLHEAPIVAHAFKESHFTRGKDGAPSEIVPPLSADADKGDQDTLVLAMGFEPRYFTRDNKTGGAPDETVQLSATGAAKAGDAAPCVFSIMPMNSGKDYKAREVDVAQPVMTQPVGGNQGGDYVVQPVAFDTTQITNPDNRSQPHPGDPCHTLPAHGHAPAIAFSCKDHGGDVGDELAPTLRAMHEEDGNANAGGQVAVAFNIYPAGGQGKYLEASQTDLSSTLGVTTSERGTRLTTGTAVRRLTPRECERLQGFADDYTLIDVRGKPAADGPRYRALGNSMAVPVMAWIGKRIAEVSKI